ncbi:MAG: hypothetical protein FWF87_06200 [Synergistaceae bacterium]|nr:hypothetical protein [Synergistaceae bacterium]
MYFLFKKSPLGVLNIWSEGVCRFVEEYLERHNLKSISCRSFYIQSKRDKALIVLNRKDDEAEKIISDLMDAIGIKTAFIYAFDGEPDINFVHKITSSMRSPWFYCSLTALAALFVFIGLSGLFWLSFWGSVGWFGSKFTMFLRLSPWRSSIGKN